MGNKYIVLISKSQLNNEVNSNVDFQKMFYSKFSCSRHTNWKLAILQDFAEGSVGIVCG